MIKGIYPGGKYTQVNNGSPTWPSIYNTYSTQNNPGAQSFAGEMRYNTATGNLEIFDGSVWQMMGNSVAQVGLSHEAERILDWAKDRMNEDSSLKERLEKYPGLKDAYEKFKILDILTAQENKND